MLYKFEYIFFMITFKKTCAHFFRMKIVFMMLNFIDQCQFWLLESLTYTAKSLSLFLDECLRSMWLKHSTVIEDCDHVIFITTSTYKVMLTKNWDVDDCKIKVSKKFTQSEKLLWIIFNWYLTSATLNKHLLVMTWNVISLL